MSKKALIAMSGGVDSSVAAYLMKEAGYDCIGVTMKLYDNEDIGMEREKTCCSLSDIEDARSVAYKLGIPYYVFNFKDDFKEKVIDNFIVDFYCHKAFLVIEIDGSQHYSENGLAYDDHRTDILSKYNLKVIRFTNTEVDKSFKEVCACIDFNVRNRLLIGRR